MLAKRLVPCLDVDGGRVVKGVRFVSLKDAGDPVECAARYDAEGADELVFLDITASSDARPIVLDMVRRVADAVFIPFTVGGGVRSVRDADDLLRAGADKVAVNTAAVAARQAGSATPYSSCLTVFSFWRNWSVGSIVMQSQGHTWWQSVQPIQRGRSIVHTWWTCS